MHPQVRALYKELLFTAAVYGHQPLPRMREKIRAPFLASRHLAPGSPEWRRALAWGRFELKNMRALHEVKQFRSLRDSYDPRVVAADGSEEVVESSFATPYSSLTAPKP